MLVHHILLALTASAITLAISAEALAQNVPFPGGAEFLAKKDEMTDKKLCFVSTPMVGGVQVVVYGPDSAAIWVVDRNRSPVAGNPAPMLRISKDAPVQLIAGSKPDRIDIPKAATRKFIEALYTQKKVTVRWTRVLTNDQFTDEIEIGDLGSAYDHAVKACGWKPMRVKRIPLSKEPRIYEGIKVT
jgi:hypothetical protein